MAPKINQDLIKARLAPVDPPQGSADYGRSYDRDLIDDDEPIDEGSVLSTPVFAGLAAVLCLLVGGAIYYMMDGFGLSGAAAPQSLAIDARCGSGWQQGMPNDVQLRCYMTTNVKRLCDPAERRHLAEVMNRHDEDTAKWENALWSAGFGTIAAVSDRSTEIGVLGARASEALKNGDQAAYERYNKEAKAIAKEIADKPVNLVKDARHDLPNPELEQEIAKLISQGLLSGADFWWTRPLLYRRAVEKVKPEDIKSVCS